MERTYSDQYYKGKEAIETEGIFCNNTFKIRLAVAAVFVLLVMLLDMSNKSVAGISMDKLYQAIEVDYGTVIDIFMQDLSIQ